MALLLLTGIFNSFQNPVSQEKGNSRNGSFPFNFLLETIYEMSETIFKMSETLDKMSETVRKMPETANQYFATAVDVSQRRCLFVKNRCKTLGIVPRWPMDKCSLPCH